MLNDEPKDEPPKGEPRGDVPDYEARATDLAQMAALGLDPTNDMLEGERHVQIGIGRDYGDVPPLRGVFKGARRQALSVEVRVSRTTGEAVEE